MSRKPKDIEKVEKNFSGTIAIILLSILFIGIASMMLFLNQMKLEYICYGAGVLFIVWGIFLIGRYFLYGLYRTVSNYDFAIGTMLVIIGGYVLIKGEDVITNVNLFFGILLMISSVIMLQSAVQLKTLKGAMWLPELIIAILSILATLLVLLNFKNLISQHEDWMYYIMLAVGVFGILSPIIVGARTTRYAKEEEAAYQRNLEAEGDIILNQPQIYQESVVTDSIEEKTEPVIEEIAGEDKNKKESKFKNPFGKSKDKDSASFKETKASDSSDHNTDIYEEPDIEDEIISDEE